MGLLTSSQKLSQFREAKHANMAFADQVAYDNKGGWTDRGPGDDLVGFEYGVRSFGGMEFDILDSERNEGKAIITFTSSEFPAGIKSATIDLTKQNLSGKYLYLLHTASYADSRNNPAGYIDIEFSK